MFDFGKWTSAFNDLLLGCMPEWCAVLIECVLIAVAILGAYTVLALFYILYERKLCAWFQCRLGPMRVGPWGLLQVFADMFKILIKEIISIKNTDKFLFRLAPFIVIVSSVTMLACLPWGNGLQIINFNIGIFFILAVSSVGVLGILLAGWSSNNKYTLIGAIRSGAQMVSYEISLGLSIITIVLFAGTMNINELVMEQESAWFLFRGHIPAIIAFLIYIVAATAETNRGPFDLPEAEHELVAGYHTEYSGITFGFYYLAEYLNLFIVSGIASLMFLGGWMPLHIPGWEAFNNIMNYIPSIVWFLGKAFFISFVIIWFKWTFPRVRIDQLLAFEWKYLMPLSLANLVLMAVFVALNWHF
ncbi:MAG: NADH-quinone oxidoreductase subunit NuoH [Bacteroides sp.]|nr:NADH-quinone oxidoreductase subunit NuoH [Bacteroidales bacterium]MBD5296055.1 NADH-quinone oxidoreductase subunit NuoH [Bacteroides sp.]MDE6234434.1 NADH-quinone oxidoreductase subunit NuoH [Muribaculaceae bacterium]